jgi:glucose dehydrogenase
MVEEFAAKGFKATGSPSLGSMSATAGGLILVAATTDCRFRAFDSRPGNEV